MKGAAVIFFTLIAVLALPASRAGEPLILEKALQEALSANPELAASYARASAEHSAIRAQYSPDNPRIGFMREKDMDLMQQEMGPMNSWTISQEFRFPVNYFLMGSAQKSRAEASDQAALEKRFEIRGKLISTYYSLYAADRIMGLFEAQKETLRQIARIAESKYSTGTASQQDQMKAHVEQVKVENELLMARQERESMSAMLNALLNREPSDEIQLPATALPVPALTSAIDGAVSAVSKTSQRIRASEFNLREATTNQTLSKWNYAPDIMLSYQKPFTSSPSDAYAFSIELGIPLWFFMKQTSEVAAASARALEAEKSHEMLVRDTSAEAKSLLAKAKSNASLIKIYETSLIPLATNTLNSSQAAYRAGKSSFIELLDSERALYETRIGYYRTLTQYIDALVRLEQALGRSVSTLPTGNGDRQ